MTTENRERCPSVGKENAVRTGALTILDRVKYLVNLNLPLSREQSLTLLGWVHAGILGSLIVFVGMVSPLANNRSHEWSFPTGLIYPFALINAAILLLFTLPLSETHSRLPLRRTWAVALAAIYMAFSSLIGGIDKFNATPSFFGRLHLWGMDSWDYKSLLSYGCAAGLILVLFAVMARPYRLRKGADTITPWILLCAIAVANIWNRHTFGLPFYLLIGLEAYYYSAIFGVAGFVRLLVITVLLLVWPSCLILGNYWKNAGGHIEWGRISLIFGNLPGSWPSITSWWITPLPAIAVAVVMSVTRRWMRVALAIATLLIVLAAFAPMRRSAIISLFLMLIVAVFVVRPRWRLPLAVIVLPILLTGAILKFTGTVDWWQKPARDEAHLMYSRAGLRAFIERPWLGIGFGHFNHAYHSHLTLTSPPPIPAPSSHPSEPHSVYLQLITEGGLIGAFLIMLAAYQLLLQGRGVYRMMTDTMTRAMMLAVLVGTVSYLLGVGLFLGGALTMHFLGPHAILLGAILGLQQSCRSSEGSAASRRNVSRITSAGKVWWLPRWCWYILFLLATLGTALLLRPVLARVSTQNAFAEEEKGRYQRITAFIDRRILSGVDSEKAAGTMLVKARAAYLFGHLDDARTVCGNLLEEHPETSYAQEARKLLAEIGRVEPMDDLGAPASSSSK